MSEEKGEHRVTFEKSVAVQIMAIDGTRGRPCTLKGVSETRAVVVVEDSVQGLNLKEFFLLPSLTRLAYRRMNGDQMGVNFLHHRGKRKKPKPYDFV